MKIDNLIFCIFYFFWALSGIIPVVWFHKKHKNPGVYGLIIFALIMGPCMILEAIEFDKREEERHGKKI